MQKLKQKCRAKPFCVKAILLRFEARFVNRQVCSWVEEPYHKDVLLSLKLFIMFGESEKRQHVLAFFPRWEKLLQSKSIFSKHHWRSASLFRVQTDQKGICLYPFYWPVRGVLNWKWLCQRLSSKNGKKNVLSTKNEVFQCEYWLWIRFQFHRKQIRWHFQLWFQAISDKIAGKFRLNKLVPSNWCKD